MTYSSVHERFAPLLPPAASPSFCVPAPDKPHLAVINAPPADQDDGATQQDFPLNSIMLSGDAKFAQAEYALNPTFVHAFPNSAANCENDIYPLDGNAILFFF